MVKLQGDEYTRSWQNFRKKGKKFRKGGRKSFFFHFLVGETEKGEENFLGRTKPGGNYGIFIPILHYLMNLKCRHIRDKKK